MPYLLVSDFQAGLDVRKSATTAPPGTLRELTTGFVNAGGEIEKRQRFLALGPIALPAPNAAPTNTSGLASRGGSLTTFTLIAGAIGAGVTWLNATSLNLSALPLAQISRILDVQLFNNKLYVVVRLVGGAIVHFYDGTVVPGVDGTAVRAHKSKLFAVDGLNLLFSGVRDATQWTPGTAGAGIIDVSTEDAEETALVGLEEYYGSLALFGQSSVQIWDMDPDPALSQIRQVIGGVGLVASNALARIGSGDILFLSDTGVRSLRTRDTVGSAGVVDVGSPVDNLLRARRNTLQPLDAEKITAVVDPLTGQFMLFWGTQVYVLSSYANSNVSAWSTFDLGFSVDEVAVAGARIVLRSGSFLYLYGRLPDGYPGTNPYLFNTPIGDAEGPFPPTGAAGNDKNPYDESRVTVVTPFMDAGDPSAVKIWTGLDVSCSGLWKVSACASPPNIPTPVLGPYGGAVNSDPGMTDLTKWTKTGAGIVTALLDRFVVDGEAALESQPAPVNLLLNYLAEITILQTEGPPRAADAYITFQDNAGVFISTAPTGWPFPNGGQPLLSASTPVNIMRVDRLFFGPDYTPQIPANAATFRIGFRANVGAAPGTGARQSFLNARLVPQINYAASTGLSPVWTEVATITGPTWELGRIPLEMTGTHMALKFESQGDGPAKLSSLALHYQGGEQS